MKISVIIPTMWLSDYLPLMVERYLSCDIVEEVLIIDNNPKNKKPLPGARFIYSGENIYVNPAWNLGVKEASSEYVVIANDDIIIDNLTDTLQFLINNIQPRQIVGLDFKGNEFSLISVADYAHTENYQGWGGFMFLRKSDYLTIPDDLLIWCGDNYLWQHLSPFCMTGIKGYHCQAKTVNSVDFSHIIKNDSDIYHSTYAKEKPLSSGLLGPFSPLHSARICHIIMSCNRPEYLIPTLNSIRKIDFGHHKVHRVLVDDYPKNRNNEFFTRLAFTYGIDELVLNKENKGLSVVWTELYELLKGRGYDYVLQQEDDVVLLHPVDINMLCDIIQEPDVCSCVLTRQPWYSEEQPYSKLDSDKIIRDCRVEYKDELFSPMFTFYNADIMHEPFKETHNVNLNEALIMQHLRKKGMRVAHLKTINGNNFIEHIGEHKTGKIILEGEPGYEQFKRYDPNKKYNSRTGELIK